MFENESYEKTLERMLSRVSDKFDKREGSIIFDTLSPTALEFQFLYLNLERVIKEAYGDTASREFLVLRCRERGITPYPATKAILKGEFTPTDIDVTGKRFSIDSLNFTVTKRITDGVYEVECETPGRVGGQYLGAMVPIDYIRDLQTAQLTQVLVPGEDEEDTEALRERYFNSFTAQSFGGNAADYLEKVNAIRGVGGVKVVRVWNNDLKPAELIPSEEITRWYENILPTLSEPVSSWLERIYSAAVEKKLTTGGSVGIYFVNSDFDIPAHELIDSVQTQIDPVQNAGEGLGIAPIGHVVKVEAAVGVTVNITTNLVFEDGYGWDDLQSRLNEVVSEYLLELRKEWAGSNNLVVRISQIDTRILSVDGIVDISGTRVNDVSENLILGSFEVPIFGRCGPWIQNET